LTGIELDRVETLLRERSAEMTRTRDAARVHLSLDGSSTVEVATPADPPPVVEVTHQDACVDCGEGISAARLKALPGAVRCVSCQHQLESQAG
jgi:hypothetical protein